MLCTFSETTGRVAPLADGCGNVAWARLPVTDGSLAHAGQSCRNVIMAGPAGGEAMVCRTSAGDAGAEPNRSEAATTLRDQVIWTYRSPIAVVSSGSREHLDAMDRRNGLHDDFPYAMSHYRRNSGIAMARHQPLLRGCDAVELFAGRRRCETSRECCGEFGRCERVMDEFGHSRRCQQARGEVMR